MRKQEVIIMLVDYESDLIPPEDWDWGELLLEEEKEDITLTVLTPERIQDLLGHSTIEETAELY